VDPVIALLLCSSPFAGLPAGHANLHAAAVSHAIVVDASRPEAFLFHGILRVADTPSSTSSVGQWRTIIAEAAQRFGLPEAWIRAVIRAESGGQATVDGRPITSSAGAIGLMQVMPDTYAEMRRRHDLGPDPADPHDNILAGTAYLREMLDRFGYPNLFAAYNAGPDRFEAYRRGELPLPAETQAYLAQLEIDLAHESDRAIPPATSSPQSGAVDGRRASNPLLFFPLGRRSILFVEPHDSASPTEAFKPNSALGPPRNQTPFVPPDSAPLSPNGDQGPP
jgi:Transglycosylase SLT domain